MWQNIHIISTHISKAQNAGERNHQIETFTMFMDWKIEYVKISVLSELTLESMQSESRLRQDFFFFR